MSTLSFPTALGPVTVTEADGAISGLIFRKTKSVGKATPLLEQCRAEVLEYLAGKRDAFTVPLHVTGTPFDRSVLTAMRKIGFGKTESYASIARKIGKPKAYRAVANACGRNRTPILIPCHRVVASSGLGGFSGGIARKKALLGVEMRRTNG